MKIINKIGKYRTGQWYKRDVSKIEVITVHHTAIPLSAYKNNDELLKYLQNIHQGHGWAGLAYHFVITADGSVFQCNDLTDVTWHDTINYDSIGVCLNGYFHPDVNDQPTKEQLKSLDELLDELCTKHPEFPADASSVVGHRERCATACPGNNLFPFVVEYRQKNGSPTWEVKETEKTMTNKEDDLRLSRDKWKSDYKELEKKFNDLSKKYEDLKKEIEPSKNSVTVEEKSSLYKILEKVFKK